MSEFEQDYIMRQIKNLAGALAKLLFHKQSPTYTVTSEEHRTDADKLYLELGNLLDEGRVNEAENLLFERMTRPAPKSSKSQSIFMTASTAGRTQRSRPAAIPAQRSGRDCSPRCAFTMCPWNRSSPISRRKTKQR